MEFPTRTQIEELIDPQPPPTFRRVTYEPETERLEQPAVAARDELEGLALSTLESGSRVAVGVGSRGIHAIDDITAAVVSELADRGFEPVVIPAMGSHGGATAEGQRETLGRVGITETRLGVPIDARMDTEQVDVASVGETTTPVYLASAALEADALLVINRIKPHTNFTGRIESGLCKMLTVGLGKQRGARAFHSTAIAEGYVPTIESMLEVVRESTTLLGGVGIVENFHEHTARIEAVPAEDLEGREPALLEVAREEMATLPMSALDLLVVDELGKEISGAGMDTNVIGRYRVLNAPDPDEPAIDLIYARGLTEETAGNGNGIGLADITRQRAIDQLDLKKTYANALTSGSLSKATLPPVVPDDELALRIALNALGGYDPDDVRIAWIENTTHLREFRVSEATLESLPSAATVGDPERLTFADGTAVFESL